MTKTQARRRVRQQEAEAAQRRLERASQCARAKADAAGDEQVMNAWREAGEALHEFLRAVVAIFRGQR